MSRVWLGFLVDQIIICVTLFFVLLSCEWAGQGVFSVSAFMFLCPFLLATSVEGPIICESSNLKLGRKKQTGFWMQVAFAFSLGLFVSVAVCLLAWILERSHPFALFSAKPTGLKIGLESLEEGWVLVKLQFAVCGFSNALFHGVSAYIRGIEPGTFRGVRNVSGTDSIEVQ